MSESTFKAVMLFMCGWLVGAETILLVLTINGTFDRSDLFNADRACRPGMAQELMWPATFLDMFEAKRAVCIGGESETWIVRVP